MKNNNIKKIKNQHNSANVLCIGGLDPSGGAGITSDILSISRLGLRPFSLATALTVQNDRKVYNISPVESVFFRKQAEAILDFIPIQAIKIGMVYNKEVFLTLLTIIQKFSLPVIWDPVMDSSSGFSMMDEYIRKNFHKAFNNITVLTPNIPEAEKLTKKKILTKEDMLKAAETLSKMGCKCVLIKGGHLQGEICDLLYYMGNVFFFKKIKKNLGKGVRGTGCALSSAISAHIACKFSIVESVEKSINWLSKELDSIEAVTEDGYSFLYGR